MEGKFIVLRWASQSFTAVADQVNHIITLKLNPGKEAPGRFKTPDKAM